LLHETFQGKRKKRRKVKNYQILPYADIKQSTGIMVSQKSGKRKCELRYPVVIQKVSFSKPSESTPILTRCTGLYVGFIRF